ncbi:MAG TPA: proteasome subunit beta [Acidimicrobiales bacterium]|nr:proteasome subunit beta [Acidimicrobiales bacterium]
MTLPMFPPGEGPGPDFSEVLRRVGSAIFGAGPGAWPHSLPGSGPAGGVTQMAGGAGVAPSRGQSSLDIPHGTTICAVRYGDGVVMAGDRRATAGSAIAHRTMEKVHPADTHSGVAIAGAAGTAMEMVRLFQLQLEHYEKVEGQALSLDGKANQLSQMVRSNLAMAMQGFVVVPLFAGYDLRRERGRIYTYDFTGGRYEETDYHADGSGGRDARTTIKLGFREDMTREEGIELCVRALWQAADEDSATGGPDAVRGIYPTVATITAAGFERVPEDQVAEAFERVINTLSSAEVNNALTGRARGSSGRPSSSGRRSGTRRVPAPGTAGSAGEPAAGAEGKPSAARRSKRP